MDLKQSASELGRQIGAGKIAPEELAEAYLDAAARHPLAGRIYARMTEDRARAEAAAAGKRAREGNRRGLLDGVPLSWKDLFDTAGIVTEAGSRLLEGRVPDTDAEVLAAATAGGTVCLGKTHLSELAFSGLGLNPMTATAPCVHDPDAVAGGSTSGGAASVAHGLAPATIGSDTGGSVRIPAAWNDLVGFKTTHGWLSLKGAVPLAARFDTVGPLARSVEDCAELIALMAGIKAPDLGSADLGGMRFLRLTGLVEEQVREAPASGYDSAVTRLAKAGATITEAALPMPAEALAVAATVVAPEAYGTWKDVIEAAPGKMFPPILARFRGGIGIEAADYVAAWQKLDRIRDAWRAATAGYDAVILPTSAILPPKIDALLADEAFFTQENLLALRNTRIGNLLGLCGVTLPTGTPSAGISFWGNAGEDLRLMQVAAAAERALA